VVADTRRRWRQYRVGPGYGTGGHQRRKHALIRRWRWRGW
jgi:hypothetical protein